LIKKIIVIGGAGFLGSNIINILQNSNQFEVTCGDIVSNKSKKFKYEEINILDKNSLHKKLDKYNIIINCTGQITKLFDTCFTLNTTGTENLAVVVKDLKKRLIQISTVAVYGTSKYSNEKSSLQPETSYAAAKAYAEKTILGICNKKQTTILRLCNLYGSNQTKGVFAYLIRSYLTDQKLNFNNNGQLVRSFLHVNDCSRIIYEIVKNNNIHGIYNIKGPDTYSIRELIDLFEERFKVVFDKLFGSQLPWENINFLDDSKLSSIINFQPQWNIIDFFQHEIKGIKND